MFIPMNVRWRVLGKSMARPTYWNKERILNKIQEFINDNGRVPTTKEVDTLKGFPKRLSIQKTFNMNYDEIISIYFNTYYHRISGNQYHMYSKEQLLEDFKQQYISMNNPTMDYYNRHRKKGSPQCNYIAKLYNITYNELLDMCQFEIQGYNYKSSVRPQIKPRILQCEMITPSSITNDKLDLLKEIVNQKM